MFLTDINGDGFPDVVVSDISPILKEKPTPYFLAVNDGKGHFTPLDPASLGPPFKGSHLWPADVTGTGRTDLVGLSVFGDAVGKSYQVKGFDIVTYENIPNGGIKLTATRTSEAGDYSQGDWVDSQFHTFIAGAKQGENVADFHIQGNVAADGDLTNLQFAFEPALGKRVPKGLAKCDGPAPVAYGDGQYRALIGFRKTGSGWVAVDAACHMKNSSRLDAFMMHYVLTSLREIAGDMVASGSINAVKSPVVQSWLKRVAAGEVVLSEGSSGGAAKPTRTYTTEQHSGSHDNWVNSNLVIEIKGAKRGQNNVDVNFQGNISSDDFFDLKVVFNPPLGKKPPKALVQCGGPAPVAYDDGQYRAVVEFQKQGNTWTAENLDCDMKNSSRLDAFMMKYVTTSFREVAADMVSSGTVDSVKSPLFQDWLKKVAAGEIVVR